MPRVTVIFFIQAVTSATVRMDLAEKTVKVSDAYTRGLCFSACTPTTGCFSLYRSTCVVFIFLINAAFLQYSYAVQWKQFETNESDFNCGILKPVLWNFMLHILNCCLTKCWQDLSPYWQKLLKSLSFFAKFSFLRAKLILSSIEMLVCASCHEDCCQCINFVTSDW